MKMPWRSSKTMEGQVLKLIDYLGLTKKEFDDSINEGDEPKYWKSAVYTKILTVYPFVNQSWLKYDEGGMIQSVAGAPLNRLLGCCVCKDIKLVDIANAINWHPKVMINTLLDDDDVSKALLQVIMYKYPDINPDWLLHGRVPIIIRKPLEQEPVAETKEEPVAETKEEPVTEPEPACEPQQRRIDRLERFVKSKHSSWSYIEDLSVKAFKLITEARKDRLKDIEDWIVDLLAKNHRFLNKEWLATGNGEMLLVPEENTSDRLLKYIKYKKQVPKPFLRKCKAWDGVLSRTSFGPGLTDKVIDKVCDFCKDLNKDWLKTGKGDMLIAGVKFDIKPQYSRTIFLDRTGSCIDRIYQFIKAKGTTISDVASKSGVFHTTFVIARTRKMDVGDQTVVKVLKAYPEINPEWLWHGKGEMLVKKRVVKRPKPVAAIPEQTIPEQVTSETSEKPPVEILVKSDVTLELTVTLFNDIIIPLSVVGLDESLKGHIIFAVEDKESKMAMISFSYNMIKEITICSGQLTAKDMLIKLLKTDIPTRV